MVTKIGFLAIFLVDWGCKNIVKNTLPDRLMVVASSATRRKGGDTIMFYTYVIKSKKNNRLYYGSTDDLKRRIKEHNDGIGGKYTRDNRPFELLYYEAYVSYDLAKKAEKFYKTGYGREILKAKLTK
ncbi:MAG: hypothetical protein COV02_00065 [Candidatus Terrybacteria bacterium CG10_big_fil_rev_8_21_14_0_10_41_10]|uniref:GIY-YIG domain-containing protein n=1 Tax=Candidatus Terrybacteria bacterium CG10_big_fil_rev_8_21_14_0_10_41_10 TaxID=1975026 RepID=A0A2M8LBY9_9BACT|nr:MAG: hypothetical protein COV02_00065 [Candidatus Terrybacteria bacterium CG10_big_fil_rev_8_21_14_0_10_41_10]